MASTRVSLDNFRRRVLTATVCITNGCQYPSIRRPQRVSLDILTSFIAMRSFTSSALLSVLFFSSAIIVESKDPKPCTIVSPVTEAYYDLNTIAVQPLIDHKPAHKDDKKESWHARGYDYGTNFTLNFCRPVIEDLQDVVGVQESHWKNVSAFYRYNDKVYSIGCVHVSRLQSASIFSPRDIPDQC